MKKNKGFVFLLGILVIVALACNLPSVTPTPLVDVDATITSLAFTQAASPNQITIPVQPEFTGTITQTPTIMPTGTQSIPMVSVSVNTNCRIGPGVIYDYLTALLVGEKAEVIGKYTSVSPAYWIIKKGGITCWLWGQYAIVEGNTSSLPEMIPPPSPTPTSTATSTATPTATSTTPPPSGDLSIIEIIMKTNFEVAVRVETNPTGSLSGNFQYTVYSDGSQVQQGSCTVPTGSNLCSTGYIVGSTPESIQVVIDSSNTIAETNEGNNTMTVNCDKFALACS